MPAYIFILSPSLTERVEYQTVGKILALIVVGVVDALCAKTFNGPLKTQKVKTSNSIGKYFFIFLLTLIKLIALKTCERSCYCCFETSHIVVNNVHTENQNQYDQAVSNESWMSFIHSDKQF